MTTPATAGPPTCVRCRQRRAQPGLILEGQTCHSCFARAARTRGRCPRCGLERLLPGLANGAPVCRDCAHIARTFTCARCGVEGWLHRRQVCVRCRLDDLARELLADSTGAVRPELEPLVPVLARCYKSSPEARLRWLTRARNRALLRALVTGKLKLDHAALDAHPDQRGIPYLRALLVTAGCVPTVDHHLRAFHTWLHGRLDKLTEHPHALLLRQFGLWHHLPRMTAKAHQQPLTPNAPTYAQLEFNRAVAFCDWLHHHELRLDQLTQPALDDYYQTLVPAYQQSLSGFLNWARETNRMPPLRYTRPQFRIGEALTQPQRLTLLRHLLHAEDKPLAPRVAAMILLLYAQPITRILTLTLDDVLHNEGVSLRLGDPPTPVPQPFANLLLTLTATRADSGGDRWLFTGRMIGRPLHAQVLAKQLRQLGVPLRLARASALRQLVLDVPAPIVAQALGFHHTTTHRQHNHAGGTWNRYITTRN